MTRRFTGWHMTGIIVGFFSVVIVVNVIMATLAIKTFGGTVVDDSYRASQQFNEWLKEAESQDKNGWRAEVSGLESGHIRVLLHFPDGVSSDVALTGSAIHPLGSEAPQELTFKREDAIFTTLQPVPAGRRVVRLVATGPEGVLARFEQDLGQ